LARKAACQPSRFYRPARIDGLPGFISVGEDGVVQTTAIAVEAGRIHAIYVVRNPDKLQRLLQMTPELAAFFSVG
jgi:RNA polymerase sigma-70 factor (ECF subfamily)